MKDSHQDIRVHIHNDTDTGYTQSATKTENAKVFKKDFGSGKQFSGGNFHFLAAGKLTFWGGGITSKLAS